MRKIQASPGTSSSWEQKVVYPVRSVKSMKTLLHQGQNDLSVVSFGCQVPSKPTHRQDLRQQLRARFKCNTISEAIWITDVSMPRIPSSTPRRQNTSSGAGSPKRIYATIYDMSKAGAVCCLCHERSAFRLSRMSFVLGSLT
jgi:hypothetical protein